MSKLFVVTCDASDVGMGATLEQDGKLVEAVSHGFNDTEKRWPVREKEAYALIYSLRKWRHLLLGRKFVVRTDCKPLLWLRSCKDHLGKLGKWAMTLFEFDPGLTLEHISGKENRVADGMSRVRIATAGILKEKWTVETNNDQQIQEFLKDDNTSLSDGVAVQNTKYGQRLLVPKSMVPEVLKAYHSDPMGGHLGEAKVLGRIMERYTWQGMRKDVKKMCKDCKMCATCKDYGASSKGPLHPIKVDHLTPFDKVGLDIVGPLTESTEGLKYLIVLQCYFTKWPVVGCFKSCEAFVVTKWLRDCVFTVYGVPTELVTDLGTQFSSTEFEEFLKKNGVRHLKTAPFTPSTDGLVERFNRTLLNSLRCYSQDDPAEWPEFVQPCVFAYRASKHRSTGYSPFEMLQLRSPRMGIDIPPIKNTSDSTDILEVPSYGNNPN